MSVIYQSTVMGRAPAVLRMSSQWMASRVMAAWATATMVNVHRGNFSVWRCMDQVRSCTTVCFWCWDIPWKHKVNIIVDLSMSTAAEVGSQFCYDQNTRGIYYAFCKRPAKDRFIPCQKEWVPSKLYLRLYKCCKINGIKIKVFRCSHILK